MNHKLQGDHYGVANVVNVANKNVDSYFLSAIALFYLTSAHLVTALVRLYLENVLFVLRG